MNRFCAFRRTISIALLLVLFGGIAAAAGPALVNATPRGTASSTCTPDKNPKKTDFKYVIANGDRQAIGVMWQSPSGTPFLGTNNLAPGAELSSRTESFRACGEADGTIIWDGSVTFPANVLRPGVGGMRAAAVVGGTPDDAQLLTAFSADAFTGALVASAVPQDGFAVTVTYSLAFAAPGAETVTVNILAPPAASRSVSFPAGQAHAGAWTESWTEAGSPCELDAHVQVSVSGVGGVTTRSLTFPANVMAAC